VAVPSTLTLPDTADRPFFEAVLRGIGAPVTGNTLASLYAWRQAEGGKAAYNPFNTTWKLPGSTRYGTNTHGVQNYTSPQQGVEATVKTLLGSKYTGIVKALREDRRPEEVAAAIIASPWGTKDLLTRVVAMFRSGRMVVNPLATVSGAPSIASLTPAPVVTSTASEPRRQPPVRRRSKVALWIAAGGVAVLLSIAAFAIFSGPRAAAVPRMPSAAAFKANRRRRRR
jgi:hypothetical protein